MIHFFQKLKKLGSMLFVPGNLLVLGAAIICGFIIFLASPEECVIIGCRDSAFPGTKYCHYHRCDCYGCNLKRWGAKYCKEHSCNIPNCQNIEIENGRCKWHYDHTCSIYIYNPDISDPYSEKIVCQRKFLAEKNENNRCSYCHYKNCNREKSYFSIFCDEHECIETGCSQAVNPGSFYCSIHKAPPRENFFGKKKSSTNNYYYYYGGGSSHSTSSYDSGYDDVYFDDDYDWDRYWSDPDYADGVDDALEDEGW